MTQCCQPLLQHHPAKDLVKLYRADIEIIKNLKMKVSFCITVLDKWKEPIAKNEFRPFMLRNLWRRGTNQIKWNRREGRCTGASSKTINGIKAWTFKHQLSLEEFHVIKPYYRYYALPQSLSQERLEMESAASPSTLLSIDFSKRTFKKVT